MRILAALVLFACGSSGHPASPAPQTCTTPRPSDGFSPLERAGGIQFVASAADEPLASSIYAALAPSFHGLERSRPETADRTKNLIVFGRADSNALVTKLGGPVVFERGRFRFGGRVYDDPDNGIAVVMPSPFARDRFVVAYVGNSPSGLLLTQSVPTGDHQFTVVGTPIGVVQEGDFCDGNYYAPYSVDRDGDWQAYRATLAHRETAHHVIYYEHGTKAERDIDGIAKQLESDYSAILRALAVPDLDHPIVTYLWSSRDTKKRYTGDPGNGVAIGSAVHALYTDEVSALGAHEYVHVVAGARWPGQPSALWSEGLAVAVTGEWNGVPLADAVRKLEVPSLDKLLCCFRDIDDNVSYPVAGHFVAFVMAKFGLDKLKQLYASPDPSAEARTFEAEWRSTITAGSAPTPPRPR